MLRIQTYFPQTSQDTKGCHCLFNDKIAVILSYPQQIKLK
jgi:hypothetical protein